MTADRADNEIEIQIRDEDSLDDLKEREMDHAPAEAAGAESAEERQSEERTLEIDCREKYERLSAEFQNYKRRNEQRMQDWRLYAAKDIVSQLLPVMDDFDILFRHENLPAPHLDGVRMIYDKMLSALRQLGLEPIDALGQAFDPTIHAAVLTEESDAMKEGHVLRVWQNGYLFKGTLLRPAKVVLVRQKQNGVKDGER
ncbi:nucleotide exchange factor GrpE [candidate division KSB1 bacterium]|nr:nucleotide exchange factor GrpE [candidate division KSB1 bacterium]